MSIIEQFKSFALLGAEWVMWVLVVLSVVSVAIMVERAWTFFGQRPRVESLVAIVRDLGTKGDWDQVREALVARRGVAPRVAVACLDLRHRGVAAMSEAASSARVMEKLRLERNLWYLGTVGSNAPFIGLFGTVIGVIVAFHDLSLNATGGAATVMAGISEALVATAMGLLVAIPAVISYNTFQRRIRTLLGDADALVHEIMAQIEACAEDSKERS